MKRLALALVLSFACGTAAAMSLAGTPDAPAPSPEAAAKAVNKGASGTDATDLWWNENEAGWGMQLIQNHLTIFATIYAYNAAGQPTFFVGVMTWNGSAFNGALFATTGPYFGAPFNPAAVQETQVGQITVTPVYIQQIDLVYTVNGVTVNKPGLTRLPLANDNLSGGYVGVLNQTQTCTAVLSSGTFNGRDFSATITHGGDATLTAFIATSTACSYTGSYRQEGRFGRSWGSFSCNSGEVGTFDFFEVQHYSTGIVAPYSSNSNYCDVDGILTATRQP